MDVDVQPDDVTFSVEVGYCWLLSVWAVGNTVSDEDVGAEVLCERVGWSVRETARERG